MIFTRATMDSTKPSRLITELPFSFERAALTARNHFGLSRCFSAATSGNRKLFPSYATHDIVIRVFRGALLRRCRSDGNWRAGRRVKQAGTDERILRVRRG